MGQKRDLFGSLTYQIIEISSEVGICTKGRKITIWSPRFSLEKDSFLEGWAGSTNTEQNFLPPWKAVKIINIKLLGFPVKTHEKV